MNTNLNDLAKIIKPSEIAHLATNLDGEDLVLTDIINAEVRRGAAEVISDILGRPL